MIRPAILVYGNCQADAIAACLRRLPAVTERYDVIYAPSFVHPIDGMAEIAPQDLARCAALVEQRALWHQFPYKAALPARLSHVDFPILALNALWPLQGKEPRNQPEPEFPFGRYPYGDRLLNKILTQGLTGDAALDAYQATSLAGMINITRFAAIEAERIAALDKECALPFGAWVLARFRQHRLFWTYNHPTAQLLRPLAEAVTDELARKLDLTADCADGIAGLFADGWEPADWLKVAIHPQAAEALEIEWYRQDLNYSHYRHRDVDWHQYWRHQIAFD